MTDAWPEGAILWGEDEVVWVASLDQGLDALAGQERRLVPTPTGVQQITISSNSWVWNQIFISKVGLQNENTKKVCSEFQLKLECSYISAAVRSSEIS